MSLFSDEFNSQMDPQSLQNVVLRQGQEIEMLKQSVIELQQLSSIANSGGTLEDADFGSALLDADGMHTSADLVDIGWWLPLNLSDDEVTSILCLVKRTISGTRYLYAGGTFTQIGGISANYLARYNFTTRNWEAIADNSLNGRVNSIAFDSADNLYIGGYFFNASGVAAADCIAKLSGSAWTSVGGGVSLEVMSVAIDSADNVYIGGKFLNASGVAAADYVAKLSGGAWTSVGGGVNNQVYCMAFDANDNLHIGGIFTDAGGDTDADYIAKLSGGAWVNVGGGLNGIVSAIAFDSLDNLYIGGNFTDAGGDTEADYIAKLLDGAWVNVGGGVNNGVSAIAFDANDTPYIAGAFTDAGDIEGADSVAKLVDGTWVALSNGGGVSGLDDWAYSIVVLENGSVVVGGSFDYAGAIKCQSIAIYCKPLSEALDIIASLLELYAARITVTSGTYTPTLTNVTNITASTAYSCQYIRVGGVVTVSGRVDIDPTAAGAIRLDMSLPVASNLANANELAGTASHGAVAGYSGQVSGDTTNDRASISAVTTDAANRAWHFTYTYRIL